jgi:predicted nucleotidyltransferase
MADIVALCETMQLKSIYLFGSGARTVDFKVDSDLDFLFRFQTDKAGLPLSG